MQKLQAKLSSFGAWATATRWNIQNLQNMQGQDNEWKRKTSSLYRPLEWYVRYEKYIESLPPAEQGKTLNTFKTIARLDDIYVNFNRELQSIKYASIVNENCVPIEDDEAFFHLCIRYEETQHAKDTSFLLQAYLKLEKVKHLMIDLEK